MARRFVFRLNPLLKLRKARQKDQQRVVADRLRRLARCERELAELNNAQSAAVADARRVRRETIIDLQWTLQEQRWRAHLQRRARSKEIESQELQQLLAEARAELAQRKRDVKVLENLRQRRLEAYRRDMKRAEQVELDEIATRVFLKSDRETRTLIPAMR
jgi:flagellar FliJ protein